MTEVLQIPPHLPILPLRGLVVFPMTTVPIRIGQPRSIRLIGDAIVRKQLIGLLASHDSQLETPGPDDVYRVGTVARIHQWFNATDGTLMLTLHGLLRIRVERFISESPYLTAHVSIAPEKVETSLQVEALRQTVAERFHFLTELSPAGPEELSKMVAELEDPLQLAYTVANHMKMLDLEDAQRLLELESVTAKLRTLLSLLRREVEIIELKHKTRREAQSEVPKLQYEYSLRERPKTIRPESGEIHKQLVERPRKRTKEVGISETVEKEARQQSDELVPGAAWRIFKRKLVRWGVVTVDALLLVAHLTLVYIVFLIADDFVLAQIVRSFGDLISQSEFAAALLQGTKIFAALGTAVAYALHLVYSLYLQASQVVKTLKENLQAGEP